MRARDIMTSPVHTVAADAAVADAAGLLTAKAVTALPVVDAAGSLVGMVSEGDLLAQRVPEDPTAHLWRHLADDGAPAPATVGAVMSAGAVTTTPDADVADVAELILRHDVRSVPVVVGRRVVGIISRRDILEQMDAAFPHVRSKTVVPGQGMELTHGEGARRCPRWRPFEAGRQREKDLGCGEGVAERVVRGVHRESEPAGGGLQVGLARGVLVDQSAGPQEGCGVHHGSPEGEPAGAQRPVEERPLDPGRVRDQDAVAEQPDDVVHHVVDGRCVGEVGGPQAVHGQRGHRDGTGGTHQAVSDSAAGDSPVRHDRRSVRDDVVTTQIEPGGFQVQDAELHLAPRAVRVWRRQGEAAAEPHRPGVIRRVSASSPGRPAPAPERWRGTTRVGAAG